jgi:chaperonin GroES
MGTLPHSRKECWVLPNFTPAEVKVLKHAYASTITLPMSVVREMCDPSIPLGGRVAQKLSPARDWIILELEESKYTGTLVIPDSAKDAPQIGNVIAVGPGEINIEMGSPGSGFEYAPLVTKVGDRVMFTKYSGADIEWEGKSLLLIRESEVICYIKEEK